VSWLSNTEKGLIDFSDFGSEIKKETKPASKGKRTSIKKSPITYRSILLGVGDVISTPIEPLHLSNLLLHSYY
jgi:hypothetical protein